MATAGLPSGTVTFLFTDIEGSTRLLGSAVSTATTSSLTEHNRAAARRLRRARRAGRRHAGRLVLRRLPDRGGRGGRRRRRPARPAPPGGRTSRCAWACTRASPRWARTGTSASACTARRRIGAAGHGGQVLLSWTTKGLAEEDLPPGVTIPDLGERRLKDIDQPQHLYQLEIDGLPSKFGPLKTLDVALAPQAAAHVRRRGAVGVLAAAVAIPVFALGQGDSGGGVTVQGNGVAEIDPSSNRVASTLQNGGSSPGAVTYARRLAVGRQSARPDGRTHRPGHEQRDEGAPVAGHAEHARGDAGRSLGGYLDRAARRRPPHRSAVRHRRPAGDRRERFQGWAARGGVARQRPLGGGLAGPVTRLRGGRIVGSVDPNALVGGLAVSPGSIWVTSRERTE